MFVAGLYSTFIFRKSTRVVRPESYLDFQLDSEFQFDRDLEDCNINSDSSPEMSLGYEFAPGTTPRHSSPRIKRRMFSMSPREEFMSSQEDLFDTARPKEESPVYTIPDSASPTGRIETSHPQQVTNTPNSDQFFPVVSLPSDTDHQLHFQEIDHVAEHVSADLGERDRSATIPPNLDHEGVQEQDKETVVLADEECDQLLENELTQEEKLFTTQEEEENLFTTQEEEEKLFTTLEEVAASSRKNSIPKKGRMKGKKQRTPRLCPTVIDPAVTGQICSVNYQSEVEQEVMDPEVEVSGPAPPPFRFYQRKKRTETGLSDVVVHEASFSTNTGSLRSLRPRRSSSVGDPKSAPGKQS